MIPRITALKACTQFLEEGVRQWTKGDSKHVTMPTPSLLSFAPGAD